MSGISIDIELRKILSEDEKLKDMVGDSIYAIAVDAQNAPFPYVQYSKGNVTPNYAKGVIVSDKVEFGFVIVSDDLDETIAIAERVRNLFELRTNDYFYRIELTECSEDYNNDIDAFVQYLAFTAQVKR